jgi:hypothetical protein
MKMILAAVALTIATPALAQGSASADPHADHAPAQQPGNAEGSREGHEEHDAEGECACCAKMKAAGKEMECCDTAEGASSEADPHAGHNMSDQ